MCIMFVLFHVLCMFLLFFFFKQKTAYEMRISDWSSDVCSSDLLDDAAVDPDLPLVRRRLASLAASEGLDGGYYEAQEMAEAFLDAAREANAGIEEEDSPARKSVV